MIQATHKEPALRRIEYLAVGIWIVLTVITLLGIGKGFALSVFFGGLIGILNNQWLGKHARKAVTLPENRGVSYMMFTYVLRMITLATLLALLMLYTKVNIIGLILGLSVVMLSIVCYACYNYIFHRGE